MYHFKCCSQLFPPPVDLWVSDEGTYVCEAENQFGRIQSRPATVTVTGLGKSSAWQWELLVCGQQTGSLGVMSIHADLSVCCVYVSSIQTELENIYVEYYNFSGFCLLEHFFLLAALTGISFICIFSLDLKEMIYPVVFFLIPK